MIPIKGTWSVSRHLIFLLGCKFYHVIDAEDSDGGFGGKSDRVDFWHHWFDHSSLQVISWLPVDEIKSTILQVTLFLVHLPILLWRCVQGSQLGYELGGILRCVAGQGFWDNVESFAEFGNSDLLPTTMSPTEVVKMNTQSNIDGSSSSHNLSRLKSPLGDTDRIMNRSFNFIKHPLVCSS